jgi:hypothetical protein
LHRGDQEIDNATAKLINRQLQRYSMPNLIEAGHLFQSLAQGVLYMLVPVSAAIGDGEEPAAPGNC